MLAPSLFLMLPFCGNEFLDWVINSTSDLVMSFVYILYGTECVVQHATYLMVLWIFILWVWVVLLHIYLNSTD